jgi:hypothetical protein
MATGPHGGVAWAGGTTAVGSAGLVAAALAGVVPPSLAAGSSVGGVGSKFVPPVLASALA